MFDLSVRQVARKFEKRQEGFIRQIQAALDKEAGTLTLPFLKPSFINVHPIRYRPWKALHDAMADAVKTVVSRKTSAAVYPVDIARDGTVSVITDREPVAKAFSGTSSDLEAYLSNWGPTRLGIAVTCASTSPLGFQVVVGPFGELLDQVAEATGGFSHCGTYDTALQFDLENKG